MNDNHKIKPVTDPAPTNLTDNRHLYHGDCLELIRNLPDDCIDLIYVDPPFCTRSKRNGKDGMTYHDAWGRGLDGYLDFLTTRLNAMKRLLKDTGLIFVHLDHRSVHYVKVEMDRIFSRDNFLNEIIWSYRTGGVAKKWFARKHQTILAYARSLGKHKFNVIRDGKFRTDGLNYDEDGRPYKTTLKGRLYFNKQGPALTDVWDIPFLSTVGTERLGYPDQKPLELAERIIRCATDEGDLVADFFAGSGTTLLAAENLNRKWIGADTQKHAIRIIKNRFKTNKPAN